MDKKSDSIREFEAGLFQDQGDTNLQVNDSDNEEEEAPMAARTQSILEDKKFRTIQINGSPDQHDENTGKPFHGNQINTSKYNCLNFLPLNLLLQFSKMANIYFLIVSVLQCIPNITVTDGSPTTLFPLSFVVAVSMLKDLFEDIKRKRSDKDENERKVLVANLQTKQFQEATWSSLRVGQIVKIFEKQFFPADLVLLNSSELKGMCYIETKNLDGETNMKHKIAPKEFLEPCRTEADLFNLRGKIECAEPDVLLYVFEGKGTLERGAPISLGYDNFLLRGSSLRNTDYVYGMVTYSGHDTKIMMNSPKSKPKSSTIDKSTSRFVIIIMAIQLAICIFCSLYNTIWFFSKYDELNDYLQIRTDSWYNNEALVFVIQVFTWFLLFSNFVPISLIVTLEMVKFIQAQFIQWDIMIFDKAKRMGAKVQSSNLNEELGMVKYIFSDKTGTLTCNIMEFKKMSIGHECYGKMDHEGVTQEEKERLAGVELTNCSFYDDKFFQHLNDRHHGNQFYITNYIMILAVCHTVIVQQKENRLEYNAASPDELALINAAKFFNCELKGRDEEGNVVLCWEGDTVKFKILNVLEFTSARKRMSVVVRTPDNKLMLLIKGADTMIYNRLHHDNPLEKETSDYLEGFAQIGLRTLVLGMRELSEHEYDQWNKKYEEAATALNNREEKIEAVAELIEKDIKIIGTTAIEDKLQDKVADTIKFIRDAGIKVWVLTGDKIETAINIGYSCHVLQQDTEIHIVDGKKSMDVIRQLSAAQGTINERSPTDDHALIVSGESLLKIMKQQRLKNMFLYTSGFCGVVIACRVSPKQKAEVVHLIRDYDKSATTLSIGDGANDVNMISSAHIGIGILGLEGAQAARASDYAIGQFKYLKRLLFYHGRECYRRNALLVCYSFYKNVVASLPQFWFGFPSSFSGQSNYDQWIFQFFNIFFTAFPVMWFAIFDYEHSARDFMSQPALYDMGIRNKKFGKWNLWRWLFEAAWHSIVLTAIGFAIFMSADGDGKMADLFSQGSLTLLAVIVAVTVKIIVEASQQSLWFWAICLLSVLSYFIVHWGLSLFPWSDLTGTYGYMFNVGKLYVGIIWISFAIALVDFTMGQFRLLLKGVYKKITKNRKRQNIHDRLSFDPSLTEYMLEEEKEEQQALISRRKERQSNLKEKGYSGYAFSGEAGHTPQLTDKTFYDNLGEDDFAKMRKDTLPIIMEDGNH